MQTNNEEVKQVVEPTKVSETKDLVKKKSSTNASKEKHIEPSNVLG